MAREIRLTIVDPGAVFYGLRTATPQMLEHSPGFEHSMLPTVQE